MLGFLTLSNFATKEQPTSFSDYKETIANKPRFYQINKLLKDQLLGNPEFLNEIEENVKKYYTTKSKADKNSAVNFLKLV